MYKEKIEESQKEISLIENDLESKSQEYKERLQAVADAEALLEASQAALANLKDYMNRETQALAVAKQNLNHYFTKEAEAEREQAINALIAQQPTYEEELEKAISRFIEANNSGLSFERTKDASKLVKMFDAMEKGRGFSDADIAIRGARSSYKKAIREACEAHIDNKNFDKYKRIDVLNNLLREPKVAEMVL